MQKEEQRFQDSCVLEGMTSIRALLNGHKSGVNRRPIRAILYDKSRAKALSRLLLFLGHRAEEEGFEILPVPSDELDMMTIGNTHGGIVAICGDRDIPSLLSAEKEIPKNGFFVLIEGIEDPYNFGYAIRSLYALGVSGILLSARNWYSAAGVVARASAGASEKIAVYTADPLAAVDFFHQKGYTVVAGDTRTENLLPQTKLTLPLLLIVGGEKRGISRALLDKVDTRVMIPYGRPFDAALSAASAATILGYEIMRQNQ